MHYNSNDTRKNGKKSIKTDNLNQTVLLKNYEAQTPIKLGVSWHGTDKTLVITPNYVKKNSNY